MPSPRIINADHLRLALVARRIRPGTRWAAMSDGAESNFCMPRPAGGGYLIRHEPLMGPLTAGRMGALFDRVRSHGRAEVLRTWGANMGELKTEFSNCVLRTGVAS